MIILQVLGTLFLILIVAIVVIYFLIKYKFKQFWNAVDSSASQTQPFSIHLNEDISPNWQHNKQAKKILDTLESLNFIPGSHYTVYEMEGLFLQAFFKKPLTAVLYWQKQAGYWVDLVINETDGHEYTFSNAPLGGAIEHRPMCSKTTDPKLTVEELHQHAQQIANESTADFIQLDDSNFRQYFESIYKKDMAWRNRKGGISFEEFLKTEKELPAHYKEEDIKEAFIQTKLSELEQWHEEATHEYKNVQKMNDDDFYDIDYKLLTIPFSSNIVAFLRYLEDRGFVNEDQSNKLGKLFHKEEDMQVVFDKINSLLSPELRAEHIIDMDFPLKLKLYKISENMLN